MLLFIGFSMESTSSWGFPHGKTSPGHHGVSVAWAGPFGQPAAGLTIRRSTLVPRRSTVDRNVKLGVNQDLKY